jgi:hypothetical protein
LLQLNPGILDPLAMYAALGLALDQTGCLQGMFHPRVTQPDLMFLAELLMKVPHVQIEVLVPIQAQDLFRSSRGLSRKGGPTTLTAESTVA